MLIRLHEVQRTLSGHALVSVALSASALLFAACGSQEPAAPILVQHVSYEVDDETNLTLQTATDEGLVRTDGAVRAGSGAGTALLRANAPSQGELRYRSEWQSPVYASQGEEYWYGVSLFIPDDWDQGNNPKMFDDRIIFQFHEGDGEPVFSLHLRASDNRIVLRRKVEAGTFTYPWSTEIKTERWYDFAFGVRWSKGDDGYLELYEAGEQRARYSGPTIVDGSRIYTKWGIYGQPTRVLFDEVRIARGLQALALVSPRGIAHAQRKERK